MHHEDDMLAAIAALEAQRGILDDETINTSIAALRRRLAQQAKAPPRPAMSEHHAVLHASIVSRWNATDTTSTGKALTALFELQMRLKSIAAEYGGHISSRSGYDVIAHFKGETGSTATSKALHAALHLRQEIQRANLQRLGDPYLQIGVHSAPYPIDLESTGRNNRDVQILRDLKDTAAPNEILVSYEVYRESREQFSIHYAKSLDINTDTLRMYQVLGIRKASHHDTTNMIAGVRASMVGRQQELEALQDGLRSVISERHLHTIAIVGAEGSGKSRLLTAFDAWLDVIPESVWYFRGGSTQSNQLQAYSLVKDMLLQRFKMSSDDSYEAARTKLVQGLIEVLGDEENHRAYHIGHLIGLDFSTTVHLAGVLDDAEQIRDSAFAALIRYFRNMMKRFRDPLVMILEDVHFADESSMQFFQYFVNAMRHYPILVVVTLSGACDHEVLMGFREEPHFSCLPLAPLSEQNMQLMVAELLRNVSALPRTVSKAIVRAAQGRPLYVWESIRWLIAEAAIRVAEEGWEIEERAVQLAQKLPPLQSLIMRRIESLPTEVQTLLARASIVGQVFWDKALVALDKDGDSRSGSIADGLTILLSHNMIQRRPYSTFPKADEYVFSNVFIFHHAYRLLTEEERRSYHARYATWLIGSGVNRVGHFSGIIAHHFHQAEDLSRAVKWYILAGTQAQNSYAPQSVTYHLEQALNLLAPSARDGEQRTVILEGLARAYYEQARYTEALESTQAILEYSHDPIAILSAKNMVARIYVVTGQSERAIALLDEVEAEIVAQEASHELDEILARSLLSRSRALRRLGHHQSARDFAEKARQLAQQLNSNSLLYSAYNVLGSILTTTAENYDMAAVYYNKALEIARSTRNMLWEARLINNIAEIARLRGDLQTALAMYRQSAQKARQIGNRHLLHIASANIVEAWISLEQYGDAIALLDELQAEIERSESTHFYSSVLLLVAKANLGLDLIDRAHHAARQAYESSLSLASPLLSGRVWRVLGEVAAAGGFAIPLDQESLDAETCFQRSVDHFSAVEATFENAQSYRAWAIYCFRLGQHEAGHMHWQQALARFEQINASFIIQSMQSQLPKLLSLHRGSEDHD